MSEREPDFRHEREPGIRHEQNESLSEFYSQLERYLLHEVERNAELRHELEDFIEYARLMQRIIPFDYPQRDEATYALNHVVDALAFPTLPIIPLPPDNRVHIGEHMTITLGYKAADIWPDQQVRALTLDDDTKIARSEPMGKIDITSNLPRVQNENGGVFAFARHLIRSTTESLVELARVSEVGTSPVARVDLFGGASHLARIAGKLHFTVFPIADEATRTRQTNISKGVARYVVGDLASWKEMAANYKSAEVAFISRDNLVTHFGTRAVARGFQSPRR